MDYKGYYAEQLELGQVFQDWTYGVLAAHGIMTVGYSSKLYQQKKGENKAGIEIKYDANRRITHNLYIEVAEKSHPDNPAYVDSGIYRDCNEYLIGDYDVQYRFPVSVLRGLHQTRRHREVQNRFRTSRAFLLPESEAPAWAITMYVTNKNGVMLPALQEGANRAREMMLVILQQIRSNPAQLEIWNGDLEAAL